MNGEIVDRVLDDDTSPARPNENDRDRVFNDETCRAFRREGPFVGKCLAVFGTFAIVFPLGYALPALAWSPLSQGVLNVAGATLTAVAVVGVMKLVNAVPTRETIRELKHELYHDLLELGEEIRNPETEDDPSPRPELAFGLPPEECFMVFTPTLLGVVLGPQVTDLLLSTLILVGGIALSGVIFVLTKRSDMNTYPPEDPP